MKIRASLVVFVLLVAFSIAAFAADPIVIRVDASEAPRRILHAHLTIPVSPGDTTLLYPKWMPGEHGPTGPIVNFIGPRLSAKGQSIPWERDAVDMYAYHVVVPAGVSALEADVDFVDVAGTFSAGASVTSQLALISWNTVMLYPKGIDAAQITVKASLRLPDGWKFGTALTPGLGAAKDISFDPVSLSMLIDSPVIAGAHFRAVDLGVADGRPHEIDIAADSEAALELPPGFVDGYKRLVAEEGALFGARHYNQYHWLLSLSDHVEHFGLEHHQSSDNRKPERTLLEDPERRSLAGLLSHESVHSWNGKYRRPVGLVDADYNQPMRGDLLWVYEGLTQYLGMLLVPRSGLWTPEFFRERVAQLSAKLDNEPGRGWRPLVDTAIAAQILYGSPDAWWSLRRSVDFYDESVLVWLEVDTILRNQTGGRASIDEFCHRFYGPPSSGPELKPYTFDDVVTTLNAVARYDWAKLLRTRVTSTDPHAPLGALEASGWRLVYNDTPNQALRDEETRDKFASFSFSLGIRVAEDGRILDAIPGLPAANAGVAPGMKLVAVNARRYTPDILKAALREAKQASGPVELLTENGEFYNSYRVEYHGGERYPHLERDASKPDLLGSIIAPKAQKRP